MCGKRSGVVKRLKARKAEILKLLNSGDIKWTQSVKIHAEVEYIKKVLNERINQNKTTNTPTKSTYSAIRNIAKTNKTQSPPRKTEIPKPRKECPKDCPGPLESPFCEATCLKPVR